MNANALDLLWLGVPAIWWIAGYAWVSKVPSDPYDEAVARVRASLEEGR